MSARDLRVAIFFTVPLSLSLPLSSSRFLQPSEKLETCEQDDSRRRLGKLLRVRKVRRTWRRNEEDATLEQETERKKERKERDRGEVATKRKGRVDILCDGIWEANKERDVLDSMLSLNHAKAREVRKPRAEFAEMKTRGGSLVALVLHLLSRSRRKECASVQRLDRQFLPFSYVRSFSSPFVDNGRRALNEFPK